MLFCLLLVVDSDLETGLAGGEVEANAVEVLHAAEIGVLAGAAGVDGGAGSVTADLEAGDVETLGSGDEARGVGAGPLVVGRVAKVELEPGGGELADGGQGDLTGTAGAATLGVLVKGDDLLALAGEGELDSLVTAPEAVDATIGADLVEADTLLVLGVGVLEGGGVLVLISDAAVDDHHVAAVVVRSAGVALVGDLLDGGTLGLLAAAEFFVGSGAGVRLGGGRGSGRGLDGRGSLGGSSSLGGVLGDGDRLVGDDKLTSDVAVVVSVSVTAGVSRGTDGGSQDEDGRGDLHFDLC